MSRVLVGVKRVIDYAVKVRKCVRVGLAKRLLPKSITFDR